ncbi:hypothetical protein PInf_020129 [Phytophthora infestans]|nr:hypothetical protein PInf_020129 [Phytophthora infestans]
MTENVVLKLSYAGETHRVTVPLRAVDPKKDLSYELVLAKVRETFPRLSSTLRWTLVYRDDEGDVVTLSHAFEFDEACHVLLAMTPENDDKLRTLHFCVLQRVSFREKVVAPVLQKVMELARLAREHLRNSELLEKGRDSFGRLAGQAGVAMNHIRNSELLGRGRDSLGNSAAHTRTLLLSARSGVSTHLRRAGSAVAAGIERRRSSSGSVNEFDPTDFVKSQSVAVSSPLSSEVAVTVDLRQSFSSPTPQTDIITGDSEESDEEPPALVQVGGGEQQVREAAYESDTDTLCDDDDREWDIVDTSGTAEEAIAETDGEWARELDVIRDILVDLDEELCCDLLTQHNGDIQTVLVELTNK